MKRRPQWLVWLRVKFHIWRARRDMSPVAWAAHRRAIEDASRYEDSREIERQCQAARDLVQRLETAAAVGSQEARQRLKKLMFNPIGQTAAKAASEALRRLDQQLMNGNSK